MREVIATGKTVDEATEKACLELGKSRDEVSVEILEMPIKKLFKSIPAKVKVTFTSAEEENPSKAEIVKPAQEPTVQKREVIPPQVQPKPASVTNGKVEHKEAVLEKEPEIEIELSQNAAAQKAVDYLLSIFKAIGAENVTISAYSQGDATLLRVEGEEISEKIETRGETIQALSYLTDRAVNRGVDKKEDTYLRVRLDIAGYRNRRERELIALAERTGREVAKAKRSHTLAPMNPYERLIIHTCISEMEGVTSESTGSDTERRVVVKSTAPDAIEGDDWRESHGSKTGGGRRRQGNGDFERGRRNGKPGGAPSVGGNNRREKDSYQQRPQTGTPEREFAGRQLDGNTEPVVPKRREAIKDGEDLPLYGKIEL